MSDVASDCSEPHSPEAASFSFALEESEHVTLADGSLNVADKGSVLGANELNLDLGNSSS